MDTVKSAKINKVLYAVFFVFFIGYLSTLQYRPYPFSYLVKIIPILSLAIITAFNLLEARGRFITAGLVFSALGDFFLAIPGGGFFVFGLVTFGLAHAMYILAFFRVPVIKRPGSIIAVLFLLYGFAIGYIIVPNMQRMQIPVSIYIVLIVLMGISTVAGKNNHYLVIIGAALFVISDSVIAVNMFLTKVSNSSFWIMVTYFPAQYFITKGALKTKSMVNSKEDI